MIGIRRLARKNMRNLKKCAESGMYAGNQIMVIERL